jgi:putative aldouronate transport system substrate-binding protein
VTSPTGPSADRRGFLSLLGLGAVAVASGGVLAGCGEKSARGGATQNLDKLSGVLPEQKALTVALPKPDIMGTRPVADGYTTYPAQLVDAIAEKPGTGGAPIRAMVPVWGPAPPAGASNSYFTAVNGELGATVDFSMQDGATYAEKLGAILGARDVPDLLCVPSWEVDKLPRFGDAAAALFEDLTPYLQGGNAAKYPMLSTFPTTAWRHSCWNERLMAVPNPTDNPFAWALFQRKDLLDQAGLAAPKTIDELFAIGKEVTDPGKGVWAFDDIYSIVQMLFKVPGSKQGWRLKADGTPEHKYETPEYRQAAEFMSKLYQAGLVHPDIVASKGGDAKLLLQGGKIIFKQDGIGMWQPMQAEQQKITKGFDVQPVPLFSATGGDALIWGNDEPISYLFVKKGGGQQRTEELLRIVNWLSAPLGSTEYDLREYGVEGKHHTRSAAGPSKTELGFKEIANQYFFISGRSPFVQPYPQTPQYVADLLAYCNASVKYLEKDPWLGLKFEMPAKFKAAMVPSEDKMTDIVRGRRPLTDIDAVVAEWRAAGGDEARTLLGTALTDAGR